MVTQLECPQEPVVTVEAEQSSSSLSSTFVRTRNVGPTILLIQNDLLIWKVNSFNILSAWKLPEDCTHVYSMQSPQKPDTIKREHSHSNNSNTL